MSTRDLLTAEEIQERAEEIREELERLMARPAFAPRPKARQWGFLRRCLDAVTTGSDSEFPCSRSTAAQYRYEVDDRLSRYYGRTAPPVKYAFRLRHISRAVRDGEIDATYPQTNGYVLLVADVKGAYLTKAERETEALIKAMIADAIDAEFAAYRALPKTDLTGVERFFVKGGPAYTRIKHYVEEHHRRGWIISNRDNPSTRRLMDIKSVRVRGDEAQVRTEEYWYLRWWSRTKKRYAVAYNEKNLQTYILVREDGRWLVDHNIYPPPRISAARRRWK